jgi:hypothetical protein
MSNFEVYDADMHDFDIQNSLIDIRYFVVVHVVVIHFDIQNSLIDIRYFVVVHVVVIDILKTRFHLFSRIVLLRG